MIDKLLNFSQHFALILQDLFLTNVEESVHMMMTSVGHCLKDAVVGEGVMGTGMGR